MKNKIYRIMCVMSNGQRMQFNAWEPNVVQAAARVMKKPLFDFFEERLNIWLESMRTGVGIQRCKPNLSFAPQDTALMYAWRCSKPVWQKWMIDATLVGFELWCANSKDFEAVHRIFHLNRPLMEVTEAKHEK